MAYRLIERPHKFSFCSSNPVRYIFEVTNPEAPGCALQVEVYSLAINEALQPGDLGRLITRQTLYPNPDGKVNFYCEDYLNSFLEWEFPPLTTNDVLAVTKQIRKFYVRYRQITKANPSPEWATDEANMRVVIKGGIAKEKFDRNNFFVNHLPAQKPFLTWQPADHLIGTEERRYLTYFHDDDDAPQLLLKARVVYTDGTQDTAEKPFPSLQDSLLFHLPAGLQQLGLYDLQPGKKVWYYDVSVEDAAGNVYAAPYRLNADYRKYYHVFSFVYHNSLGGIDTARIRGEYDIEVVRDYTEIEQATGGDFSTVLPTENAAINISKYEKYTGDAGWQDTREMQDALQDLLLSETVYRVVFNRWLRVMNLQKSQPLAGSDDTKFNFPLQWRYTFTNSQYTPAALDFGAGTNDEAPGPLYGTCTAPSGLAVQLFSENGAEKTYRFSWNAVAGAAGYELEYKKEGKDWTALAVEDSVKDIVFTESGDYSWRVRTQCGPGDFSGYATGAGFTLAIAAAVCAAPAKIEVILLNIDNVNAQVKFTWPAVAGTVGYVVEWREYGATNWNSAAIGDAATSFYVVQLKKDVQYEYRIKSKCNLLDFSGYVYGENFVPSNLVGTCNAPNGLEASIMMVFLAYATVMFKWNEQPGVEGYEVHWRIKDSGNAWTIVGPYPKNFAVDQLRVSRTIEWRMRSNCTGGGFSNFVNGPEFNT